MTQEFNIAKQSAIVLENAVKAASDKLREFDKYGKSSMGLTPDHVKATPEWKKAKAEYEKAFSEMRAFNGWYVKAFKKELAAERKARYTSL